MAQFENKTPKFLFYKPRQTLYEVLFSVKIKHPSTNLWLDGLAYRESGKLGSQVYVRPLEKFGDKWESYHS